jgi:outer membrane protein
MKGGHLSMSLRPAFIGLTLCLAATPAARGDTIRQALAGAYNTNPQLNAQRANTRAVDENLQAAFGAFLPTATIQSNYSMLQQDLIGLTQKTRALTTPRGAAVVVNWNIFNGFRGLNGIDQAEAQIHQSREALRNVELSVLSNGASAYMNVLRDVAIVNLRSKYERMLETQIGMTKERLVGGEATLTDVYQTEAYYAQAKQDLVSSRINLASSLSIYKQITGMTVKDLAPATVLDKFLPKSLPDALRDADQRHPLINAARYNIELTETAVRIAEGQLLPTVGVSGQVGQQFDYAGYANQRFFQSAIGLQFSMPIYEGGVLYAAIRQAKEKQSEAMFLYDQQVVQVHQAVEATWAAWRESEKLLAAARDHVAKSEAALAGIREELKYGQRTTWELLNAEATLLNARVAMVITQNQRVVSSYALLAAIGDLSAKRLDLDVTLYSPEDHYNSVKFQFIGTEPWT